ncbi:hypothetical protein [Okeania sp.]|uniref:hypothetical protein n=1 Tax=Okeania sp. TaxID=3100323 RepID=UPI002B4B1525|nr:hypothetical protein [Okeania sp.]
MTSKKWFSRFRYLCLFLATIIVLITCQTGLAEASSSTSTPERFSILLENIWLVVWF